MFNAADAFKSDFYTLPPQQLKSFISPHYAADEADYLSQLIELAQPTSDQLQATTEKARQLIEQVRAQDDAIHMVDALLLEYSLDTKEGILLMCLAEALMRIPDADTADALIKDKLSVADWQRHLKKSDSVLVNASTWGLLLTGKVTAMDSNEDGSPAGIINRLVNRLGEPVIRKVMNQAMKVMGKQFVLGRSIQEALKNSRKNRDLGYTYSYDMLGEAALTRSDADKYFEDYLNAIKAVGAETYGNNKTPRPTISIKLSALHPRYEKSHEQRVMTELFNTVVELIKVARQQSVGITIDAEEADRLEISLQLFEKLYRDPVTQGWGQFGLVVQAYSKRALPALCWLNGLAAQQGDMIPIRLVKGAYWDSEIKLCQQLGTDGYPVFTRKEATDVSYLACVQFLLSDATKNNIYPQFASHNAHTVASILSMANGREYEFQRLHGMGDGLYKAVLANHQVPVRIYAPVGAHKDLLPYLVRRLLENGANSSFVHRLVDAKTPVDELIKHPVEVLKSYACLANERIPTPLRIYGNERRNSAGTNILIESQWEPLAEQIRSFMTTSWQAGPIINGEVITTADKRPVFCPYRPGESVGEVSWATTQEVTQALSVAKGAFCAWNKQPVAERAKYLQKLANLLEDNLAELIALCHREAGKTIQDSIDEVREAVDFCRYYAVQAEKLFANAIELPGPTGESNELSLHGRGVFVCISPWNFPLAIFLGQVAAALAAGNTVIAKPAEQTSLIAFKAIQLMLEAGFPGGVIQLLPGDGAQVGAPLTSAEEIAGVAFTGSTDTAQLINRSLAARKGTIVPLIAETGGQNAMIVDSTALPEQVIQDVVHSAFASAGQRCSALRVLFVQDDVADRMLELLKGAMAELEVGDPSLLSTDLGPVIDQQAQQQLLQHINQMKQEAKLIAEVDLSGMSGYFVPPTAVEIQQISQLTKENFGPILHVVRFKASQLEQVINNINETGFGLTLGVHSRNEALTQAIADQVNVGNVYVNRNQIGAVVGVQPFGGQGLSGTGPKAGGPHYLYRFATEKVRTINTTAVGGNASLLSLTSETL